MTEENKGLDVADEVAMNNEAAEAFRTTMSGNPSTGKITGFPPGNPKYVGAGESDLRKSETAAHGAEEAMRRAWGRANAAKAARGGGTVKTGQGPRNPKSSGPIDLGAAREAAINKASPSRGQKKDDVKQWAGSVQFVHALLALRLQDDTWEISDDEAEMLTSAVMALIEEYGVKITGKAGKWGALITAVSMIYGPRLAGKIISNLRTKPAATSVATPTPDPRTNALDPRTYADLSGAH